MSCCLNAQNEISAYLLQHDSNVELVRYKNLKAFLGNMEYYER